MTIYCFTDEQMRKLLDETISLYEEFQNKYDKPRPVAAIKTVLGMMEGLDADQELALLGECKPSQVLIQDSPAAMTLINYYVKVQSQP